MRDGDGAHDFLLNLRGDFEKFEREYGGNHGFIYAELHPIAINEIFRTLDVARFATFLFTGGKIKGFEVIGTDTAFMGVPIRANSNLDVADYRLSFVLVVHNSTDPWLQSIKREEGE